MEAVADTASLQEEHQNENDDTSTTSDVKSVPAPLYTQNQRVYAKDEATGLLYPAMIRKTMWGPKSESSLPVPASLDLAHNNDNSSGENDTSNDQSMEEEADGEDDEDEHRTSPKHSCHHYYVHYMGWNVKWDRWVEEVYLYEHSDTTKLLAEKIQKEYDKVKPRKKGQRMTVEQVSRWMKKMVEVELEFRRLERDGKLPDNEVETASKTDIAAGETTANEMKDKAESKSAESASADKKGKPKDIAKPIIKEEALQKQAQLRERGLQLKRKRIHADRLHLPFTLKKILVEEWEVISQCGMLYDLPSKVSVRDALNSYLESKLLPMREKKKMDNSKTSSSGEREGDDMEIDQDNDEQQSSAINREKEWINMVEGIALLFDQALPIHLLFEQERTQYVSLRRQILAQRRSAASNVELNGNETNVDLSKNDGQPASESSDMKSATNTTSELPESKPLPDRMSEIYGCEHLLRLFIRLPAVVAATPSITEPDARRIFSKLGDLVRYIQKHQSEIFKSTFRKPLQNELRKVVREKTADIQ